MPLAIEGSCRCGAVRFSAASRTPCPYQLCYCSICRKTAGGGGYAINIGADTDSLRIEGKEDIGTFHAEIRQEDGVCEISTAERRFCTRCGTALWLFSPEWPELIHPFASAVDSDLPVPPARVHIMLRFKPFWVVPQLRNGDESFNLYPEASLEDWHRVRGLWRD